MSTRLIKALVIFVYLRLFIVSQVGVLVKGLTGCASIVQDVLQHVVSLEQVAVDLDACQDVVHQVFCGSGHGQSGFEQLGEVVMGVKPKNNRHVLELSDKSASNTDAVFEGGEAILFGSNLDVMNLLMSHCFFLSTGLYRPARCRAVYAA
jgi:hypothetical protein